MTRRLAGAGAVAAVLLAAWWLWPGDARRIRSRLTMLAAAVSVPAAESDLQRVARVAGLARALAPDVALDPGDGSGGLTGRDTVMALVSRLAIGGPTLIDLENIEVEVGPDRTRAVATALVRVRSGPDPARLLDGHVVRFELVKADGEWLLRRAAPEQALATP